MQVNVRIPVGIGDFLVVNLGKPVIGRDGAGVGQNQSAHRVGYGGVFLHTPVQTVHIIVDQLLVVQHGGLYIADLFPLFSVENIGLGHFFVAASGQNALHAVLNVFHLDLSVFYFGGIVCGNL